MELNDKRVLITGGSGFLGAHLVASFQQEGAEVVAPRSSQYDFVDPAQTRRAFRDIGPQIVVHAAADVGGIGYNQLFPADIFYKNLMMAGSILWSAKDFKVEKVVIVGSACAYPGEVSGRLGEDSFLDGPLHPSVECYGFSKRALYIGAKAFEQQYGMKAITLVITNLYGPGDKFDPRESHVVAALIRKFVEAHWNGEPEVVCWGTGSPVREFLYVADCAEAVVLAAKKYEKTKPLNLGTGEGTTIKELACMIQKLVGFEGQVVWDSSRPDGAPYKVLDVSNMERELQWRPKTSLIEGMKATIEWYKANKAQADKARRIA